MGVDNTRTAFRPSAASCRRPIRSYATLSIQLEPYLRDRSVRVANRAQYWTHTAVDGLSLTVVAGDVYAMGVPNCSSCLDSTVPFDDQRLQLVWKKAPTCSTSTTTRPLIFRTGRSPGTINAPSRISTRRSLRIGTGR